MNWNLWKHPRATDPQEPLDRAIDEWRRAGLPEETLGAEVKSRILEAAFDGRPGPVAVRPGLRPVFRRVALGSIPLLAVAVALLFSNRTGDSPGHAPLRVRAAKNGGEVVFTIANGRRSHSVYKSSVPNNFNRSSALQIRDGAFRDAVEDASGLVFYQIE